MLYGLLTVNKLSGQFDKDGRVMLSKRMSLWKMLIILLAVLVLLIKNGGSKGQE